MSEPDLPPPGGPADVTAEWLAAALADVAAFAGARFAELRSARIGEGFGLDGVVVRAEFPSGAPDRPGSVVVKFARPAPGAAELRFHRDFGPRMPIRLPLLYAGFAEPAAGRAALLFEDLTFAAQGDVLVGTTISEGLALARAQAAFHAEFATPGDPDLATLPAWNPAPGRLAGRVRERRDRFCERYGDRISARARELLESLADRVELARERLLAAPPTLIHTDLHLDNVLFLASGEPVVLDWSGPRRGPAALDVARILVECLAPDLRGRHEEIIGEYRAARAARGRPAGDDAAHDEELRAAVAVLFGHTVEWGGAERLIPDHPRVPRIVERLAEAAAAAAEDLLT